MGCTKGYLEVEKPNSKVLLIEDDRSLVRILEAFLKQEGYPVTIAHDSPEALDALTHSTPELILMDLALPPSNRVQEGIQLMEQSFQRAPCAKVVIMTGEGTLDTALACIRRGAEDYLIKPINPIALSVILERALKRQRLERLTEALQKERSANGKLGRILGKSFLMQRVFAQIQHAAQRDANVLILGESGTGKGLVAETIHDLSSRRNAPFVKVNLSIA
jgi:DNA-binding NtrC family response regulator